MPIRNRISATQIVKSSSTVTTRVGGDDADMLFKAFPDLRWLLRFKFVSNLENHIYDDSTENR